MQKSISEILNLISETLKSISEMLKVNPFGDRCVVISLVKSVALVVTKCRVGFAD